MEGELKEQFAAFFLPFGVALQRKRN